MMLQKSVHVGGNVCSFIGCVKMLRYVGFKNTSSPLSELFLSFVFMYILTYILTVLSAFHRQETVQKCSIFKCQLR